MSNQVQVQADADERDLRFVVYGTYGFAGLVALGTVMSLFTWAPLVFSGNPAGMIMGLVSIVGGILYAWANVNSARAIAAREDPHLSYFVAGMNMVAFPFGTILSMYTWRVLSRPSVRDIYADPHRPPSMPKQAAPQPKAVKKDKVLQPAPEVQLKQFEDVEEELWREMEKEHNRRKASEAADKVKIRPADEE